MNTFTSTFKTFRKAVISGLEFGASQKVNLGNGLVFLKDSPLYNQDGTFFYSYSVRNISTGELVLSGSANTLKELKEAAKAAK